MKKILPFIIAGYLFTTTSCQKEMSGQTVASNDSTQTSNLLVRYVSLWSDGTTPATDSAVITYNYDAANVLIEQHQTGQPTLYYNRDAQERLTSMITGTSADTAFSKVFYTSSTSTQVAYVLYGTTNATNAPDSMVFTYSVNHVSNTAYYRSSGGTRQLAYYQNWAYDGNGNITQLQAFNADSTFNIGYDFEYDSKVNPRYSTDDARLPVDWGYVLSPNNVTKQTNHYGNPPVMPSDYVTYTYVYNAANLPVTGGHIGTAIGTQTEDQRFYYQ